jgi:hypothetical protein
MDRHTGISNREDPETEEREREEHPPVDRESPPPQDAGGSEGEEPIGDVPNRQTSHKVGSRSVGKKEDRSRYPDRGAPSTSKVSGAFGREPQDVVDETEEPEA